MHARAKTTTHQLSHEGGKSDTTFAAPAHQANTHHDTHFQRDFSQVPTSRLSDRSQQDNKLEQEADGMATAVATGQAAQLRDVTALDGVALQRQGKEKSDSEKYQDAAKKVGEAFLKTEMGQKIEKKAKDLGASFLATLPGKIVAGTAAVGAVTAIAATNSELPMQIPEIPLDKLAPGLSMKITYEGPVQKPTAASISFTYKFGGAKQESKKPKTTESEKFRAETARMAQEQHKFREGLKTPEQRAAEQKAFMDTFWRMKANDPLNPLFLPGLKPVQEEPNLLKMRRDEETVQKKAKGHSAKRQPGVAVKNVLAHEGQPLDTPTRAAMESRFGRDFSQVRVHTDASAAASARDLDAHAYTVGAHIVFDGGQYQPGDQPGQQLLAHELTHVAQQGWAPQADRRAPGLAAAGPAHQAETRPKSLESDT